MTDTPLEDRHEWISFEDPDEDRTWVFDITFLVSNWTCIFGRGCKGVLTEDATDLVQGCCSYGAHFNDDTDRERVERAAELLDDSEWQYASEARRRGGPTKTLANGESMTRVADGACIFLNRPGFATGPGCAFHFAAERRGVSFLEYKPEVCWQLPLRRIDAEDENGHVTSTVREWKRRDWGSGGAEFHWWCTETPEAFIGGQAVYENLRDEIVALTSETAYDLVVAHIEQRRAARGTDRAFLPHPATKRPPVD